MAQSIKLPESTMALLRADAAQQVRSLAGQADFYIRLGRAVAQSSVFTHARIAMALAGRLDIDSLSGEEQEIFFEEFACAMHEASADAKARYASLSHDGVSVGLDAGDNLIYADKRPPRKSRA